VRHDPDDNWIKDASPEEQRECVTAWFHQNYEDPVHRLPLDNEDETGYAWIYGGPYDAREEIQERFEGVVPDEVLEGAIENIEFEGTWWVSRADIDEADQEAAAELLFLDAVRSNDRPVETLATALRDVDQLVREHDDDYLRQLALVGVVAALEAFLLDFFVSRVLENEGLLRRFVETDREFGKRKLELREVFQRIEDLKDEAGRYLADVVWHRLAHVVPLYTRTFQIQFPQQQLNVIGPAITKRHDIVHRGGKAKDGIRTTVSLKEIEDVIEAVRALSNSVRETIDSDPPEDSPF